MHHRLKCFCVLLILTFDVAAFSQEKKRDVFEMGGVSRPLQARLAKRLAEYVEYQRTGQWDRVRNLVADFYLIEDERKRRRLRPDQIQSIMDRIKESPANSFAARVVMGSTRNFNVPIYRTIWWVEGCAEFKQHDETLTAEARVYVYFQTDWRFTPIVFEKRQDGSFVPCAG